MATNEKELEEMDKIFKVVFIIGLILEFVIAIVVTHDATTTPLTASQVASVGIITVLLLVIGGIIYSQFPYSVLGKPVEKEKQKMEEKEK
ncbi:hypothetical protein [Acidianus sp. HS-5]|uniref:hypothetical protein n=1 Tax=Acidianus sp. HS-5 TaxID=2886040 RepID=UPI001F4393CA|nr:hypothetical protein [Acidianus sp. HS-5]BDC17173.1 hypothetical protein HS5_00630 [Acidianus sp. HS-5]